MTFQDENYVYYSGELNEQSQRSQEAEKENLDATKAKSETYYDKKQRAVDFLKGDIVYLLKGKHKYKLDDQYVGP